MKKDSTRGPTGPMFLAMDFITNPDVVKTVADNMIGWLDETEVVPWTLASTIPICIAAAPVRRLQRPARQPRSATRRHVSSATRWRDW